MHFQSFDMDKDMKQAQMFYNYKGEIIRYIIYLNQMDSSRGLTREDVEINTYELSVKNIKVKVQERKTENDEEKVLTAEFQYKGIFYQLKGKLEEKEMRKILENLKFY